MNLKGISVAEISRKIRSYASDFRDSKYSTFLSGAGPAGGVFICDDMSLLAKI
jgi:hypothetical protein